MPVDGLKARANVGMRATHLAEPEKDKCETHADGETHTEAVRDENCFPHAWIKDTNARASGIKPNAMVHELEVTRSAASV